MESKANILQMHKIAAPWKLVVFSILSDEHKHPQRPVEIVRAEALQVGTNPHQSKSKSNNEVHKES